MALTAKRIYVTHSMLFEFCNDGKINNPFTVHFLGVVLQLKTTECNESKKKSVKNRTKLTSTCTLHLVSDHSKHTLGLPGTPFRAGSRIRADSCFFSDRGCALRR